MTSARLRTTRRIGALSIALAAGTSGIVAAAGPAGAIDLASVRACESGGNYSTNTGNGFYGAYQFDQQTWNSVGGSGNPANASPAEQDAAASRLASQRGSSPWPVCGAGGGGGGSSYSTQSSSGTASRSSHRSALKSTGSSTSSHTTRHATSHGTTYLSTALEDQVRSDVKVAQRDLNKDGATLEVDGKYGKKTEAAVKKFQTKHHLQSDGVVGPQTWAALRAVR
jgi:hypothetical protein